MKILYIAHERRAAQLAAFALRRIAPDLTLIWASDPGVGLGWIRENGDAEAVIVDPGTLGPGCDAFQDQVRDLGVTTPIAVMAPEDLGALSTTLKANLESVLGPERDRSDILETRLRESEAQRQQAQRYLAERQAEQDAALGRTTKICTALQERLLELESALHTADERQAAQRAASDEMARREAELSAAVAEAAAVRTLLEQRVADAEMSRQHVQQRAAEDLAAAAERYASLEDRIARDTAERASVEEQLAAVRIAREEADRDHAAELASLTESLTARETQHETSLARTNRICTVLQGRMLELEAAVRAADERHAGDAAATERLVLRERELGEALADAMTARTALEHRLSDSETAYQRAAADLRLATERCAAFEQQLAGEVSARSTLEQRLAAAESARQAADREHAAAIAALTEESARREHEAGTALTDAMAALTDAIAGRAAVERRLVEAEVAHQETRQRSDEDLAGLAEKSAAIEDRLRQETAARATLEDRLADLRVRHDAAIDETAAVARQLAEVAADLERAGHDRMSDAAAAAERYAALEERFGEQTSARSQLEGRLAAAESARQDAEHEHASALTSLTARLADVQTQYETVVAQAASARTTLEERLTDLQVRHDAAIEQNAIFARQLAEAAADLERAAHDHMSDAAAAAQRYAALEERFGEQANARSLLEQRLAAVESARQEADHEHASALRSLTTHLADARAQYQAAAARAASVERQLGEAVQALEEARRDWKSEVATAAGRQTALQEELEAGRRDISRLQGETDGLRRRLEAMRAHTAALRSQADRVPALQQELEASQKENRRQFERAPYGLCECTREGEITRVNHSFARLLGYRTSAELQRRNVVEQVFESAADLRWLIDRSVHIGKVESVDTILKTQDRRRLSVRLHAQTKNGSTLIAVEDLTRLSEVEQRLRAAHRLEAVGRVASEVAVTCDTLLRDVSTGGRQWLAGFEDDTQLRQQGELLLGDITRAAGFLRQFVAYGNKEIRNLEPLSLQRLLRDMEPVLKRVLGDHILLILPRTMDRFDVDVDVERVERILVTVANYARERMPHGGRVKIQLATTVVDQRFLASHPKVRAGAHVLITIKEIQGAIWPALPVHLPIGRAPHADVPEPVTEKPGMDLGSLVALIADAGGHLWVSAEPAGNMTVQIHLPKRIEVMSSRAAGSWSDRGRLLTRWFRH